MTRVMTSENSGQGEQTSAKKPGFSATAAGFSQMAERRDSRHSLASSSRFSSQRRCSMEVQPRVVSGQA
jgi:hypothetical protein